MHTAPQTILVTGGAGFIGSHLIDALLDKGHTVVSVDDFSLGREENIAHLSSHPHFESIKFDILDLPALRAVFECGKFDAVFHMAANSDIQAGVSDPTVDLNKTFLTTFRVLECMRAHDVRQIVFPSSSAIYGEMPGNIAEDSGPLFPASSYGAAKLASEAAISAFVHTADSRAWMLRFPNVVGERATHGVIFDFIRKLRANSRELEILGDGKQEKPYVYVKDLVNGILFVWEKTPGPLEYYHLGVDSATTVTTIAETVVEAMGLSDVAFRYTGGSRGWKGDVPRFQYDLSKIHALGWRAPLSSDEAVRNAAERILEKNPSPAV